MKIVFFLSLGFMLAASGCSEQEFSSGGARGSIDGTCKPTKTKKCPPITSQPDPNPNLDPDDGSTTVATIEHEAVFAVRDISCALCHATIESNIISDFANKTGNASAARAFSHALHLVKHGHTSQGAKPKISGNFIVPEGNTHAYSRGVTNCQTSSLNHIYLGNIIEVPLLEKLNTCISPHFNWGAESQKFVTKKSIEINPVSSPDKIKAIATTEAAKLASDGFALVGTASLSGITGTKATGFKSTAAVACEGAVVFDAPLRLKNTKISTQKGCRIYSTASIFVFGTLNVEGPADSANLQLMSARFIGFDIKASEITTRITHNVNDFFAFSIGNGDEVNAKIASDAVLVGATEGGSTAASYSKIAASAPVVYAKNSGVFSGVIISEQFIGKIGSLSFKFDPIFKKSVTAPKLFPEIKDALVSVSAD